MGDAGTVALGPLRLERDRHIEDLCGDDADSGFGSLLFASDGRLALEAAGTTWLYTTARGDEGRWMSAARRLDPERLALGPARTVLEPEGRDRWAVIHHVLRVGEGLVLAFYSNGRGVRAALAETPGGPFRADPDFTLEPRAHWELCPSGAAASSLEANGAFVPIDEDEERLLFWEGYDSYCPSELGGELGWVKLELDKRARRVRMIEAHPANPLALRLEGYACARCGGNLASDVVLNGQRVFFYYTRRSRSELEVHAALSDDPLFQRPVFVGPFDRPLGNEEVAEKFQAYSRDGALNLFYESRLANGRWRTGVRRYRVIE